MGRWPASQVTGTLGVNLIAHPHTITALGPALDDAIAELRYGTVALNAWTGVGYLTATATWGAFPGHTLDDIHSASASCTTLCSRRGRNARSYEARSAQRPDRFCTGR